MPDQPVDGVQDVQHIAEWFMCPKVLVPIGGVFTLWSVIKAALCADHVVMCMDFFVFV